MKIVTEGHAGHFHDGDNDSRVKNQLESLGYLKSNAVPEICGWVTQCRNTLWWPDDRTEAAAMAVVRKEFEFPGIVPLLELNLPEQW